MDFRCVFLKGDTLENVKEEKKLFIILDRGPCPLEQWMRNHTEHNGLLLKIGGICADGYRLHPFKINIYSCIATLVYY